MKFFDLEMSNALSNLSRVGGRGVQYKKQTSHGKCMQIIYTGGHDISTCDESSFKSIDVCTESIIWNRGSCS